MMDFEKRFELIKSVGEEILTEEELRDLLETKKNPIAYDGFEPSGKIHIAQGIMRAINVNKMTSAGVRFKMWVADWHGWANNKMGGDLEKIQLAGKYFIEVWKACGMDLSKVEFVWANDVVTDRNPIIWTYLKDPNVGLIWSDTKGNVYQFEKKIAKIDNYSVIMTHKNLLAAAHDKLGLKGNLRKNVDDIVDNNMNARGRVVGDTIYIYSGFDKKLENTAINAIYDYIPEV